MAKFPKKKLILVAGGTGGHIHPAISLSEQLLKNPKNETYFFTDKRGKKYFDQVQSKTLYQINSSSPFRKSIKEKCLFPFFILLGFIESFLIMRRISPSVIIAFGGYTSIPSCIAAYILRIPIIIHEQNAIMGRANRLLSNFAQKITLSFQDTKRIKLKHHHKIIYVGLPLREGITKYREKDFLYKIEKGFNILIIGGSQGSRTFTDIIPKAISNLPSFIRNEIKVFQNCNIGDSKKLESIYSSLNIRHEIKDFFEDMGRYISQADLIISRAGANMVIEICTIGRASILIPLSGSIDNDQYHNASFLSDKDACILYEENIVDPVFLAKKLEILFNDKSQIVHMAKQAYESNIDIENKKFIEILEKNYL
ncbi:MAG: undecaprenyldiphospho-muramoylpentapeptide beta-N-acetylglucosaminyltransferase [Hyphomicrobiales bacterium]|nr:undecaprenyldiphospho-muramoylpentapeptide beta-N-acetylglucosaminyltransferase [Hyphomicrobiales bacterium]